MSYITSAEILKLLKDLYRGSNSYSTPQCWLLIYSSTSAEAFLKYPELQHQVSTEFLQICNKSEAPQVMKGFS